MTEVRFVGGGRVRIDKPLPEVLMSVERALKEHVFVRLDTTDGEAHVNPFTVISVVRV